MSDLRRDCPNMALLTQLSVGWCAPTAATHCLQWSSRAELLRGLLEPGDSGRAIHMHQHVHMDEQHTELAQERGGGQPLGGRRRPSLTSSGLVCNGCASGSGCADKHEDPGVQ